MIPNQWYAILESDEVKHNQAIGVTRLGERLVVWRNQRGEVACARERCPHRGVALGIGQVVGDCVECPFHGFQFDPTGRCTVIPANGKNAPVPKVFQIKAYPTREAHGFIWMWWGQPREGQTLPPVPWFSDIDDSFSYATIRDHWAVHYSRAIENQLDVVHLPFVHKTTIGRGGQTVVDGPWITLENEVMHMWFNNRVDDGAPARKLSEMTQPAQPWLIEFIFPHIWQNRLGDNIRAMIAFTPIDDANTQMYVRFYQRMVRAPIVRDVFNWVSNIGNKVILNQDKRPVVTQIPVKTDVKMDEYLIPGDRPIVMYRKRRRELIDAAQQNQQE
jgi:phenylpropionate dioxygenase-like ring-hydroxylating dioxygenase large terminal subunit